MQVHIEKNARMPVVFEKNALFADRYRLVDFLGNGKKTEVWHAYDTLTDVNVAIKFYVTDTAEEDVLGKFALVFDINHTNILHPIYVGKHDGMIYEIMQYCRLGNVAKLIEKDTSVPEEVCWKILHDVSAGLSCLHDRHRPILHLDIKPDNILIQDDCYMITDFGISDVFREEKVKAVNGTVAYMAPERFQEDNSPIKANDIWSLGATMFELMSGGELPYGEMGGSVQAPSEAQPEVSADYSPDIRRLVNKCLAFYPWDRPLAKDLAQYSYKKMQSNNTNLLNSTL